MLSARVGATCGAGTRACELEVPACYLADQLARDVEVLTLVELVGALRRSAAREIAQACGAEMRTLDVLRTPWGGDDRYCSTQGWQSTGGATCAHERA